MRHRAYIAGVGVTAFGNFVDTPLSVLAGRAIANALQDANLGAERLEAAWFGNVAAATITGQVCITGQVALRRMGIGRIPVVNVKNACATASTALHEACAFVTAGAHDVVLAVGAEKLYSPDKARTFAAFEGCIDTERAASVRCDLDRRRQLAGMTLANGQARSLFMDIYAAIVGQHMRDYGSTREQFAAVASKNSRNGAANPNAQFREPQTVEEILTAREIVYPLTLPMCSPVGDGAAAAIIVSEQFRSEQKLTRAIPVLATALASGWDKKPDEPDVVAVAARQALGDADVAAVDVDVAELHDATAPSEILHCESVGFCAPGEGGPLAASGATDLGGEIPINTSGGLLRRGHPIGATGLAQIHELVCQLRGEAGPRQVDNADIALAENSGGYLAGDAAAAVITLLGRSYA